MCDTCRPRTADYNPKSPLLKANRSKVSAYTGAVTCYTVKCFVQRVLQCFGEIMAGEVATAKIVARQVARAVAETRIKFVVRKLRPLVNSGNYAKQTRENLR